MIPNQWYAILESNEVKPGKPIGVTRMGEKMVLWRDASGKLSCMSDLCPHRGAALSVGKIIGNCIQCPFHGFEFDSSGRCKLIPANGRSTEAPKAFQVRSYPVREAHHFIYIWWYTGETKPPEEEKLPPIPWFDSIDDQAFVYATLRDPWATHYSRAIENQLDVVHLPFVHHNTIGRGNRTLVNGPIIRWECQADAHDLLNLWVYNELDTGQKPLKPAEMPAPQRRPFLQFIFPNLWQNWIADKLRIVVAFVPVDDENTLMYLRYYHTMRIPVLRQLAGWIGSLANLIIERQDRRVVITQRPKPSELRMGEKLIQGDGPIIEYRRRRKELQEASKVDRFE